MDSLRCCNPCYTVQVKLESRWRDVGDYGSLAAATEEAIRQGRAHGACPVQVRDPSGDVVASNDELVTV